MNIVDFNIFLLLLL